MYVGNYVLLTICFVLCLFLFAGQSNKDTLPYEPIKWEKELLFQRFFFSFVIFLKCLNASSVLQTYSRKGQA